jgi:predicted dehydrogenase
MGRVSGNDLRVGVIGVGWAGQRHLEAYDAVAGARVVALAGLEEPVRHALATRYRIEREVAQWQELLEVGDLDAISIAVPTFLHAPIAIAALERGVHVLCEKPIARNADEADAMVAAARGADRVLDVAFNHRQRGDIHELKAAIDGGRLGHPYYAKAWWLRRTGIPTLGSWFTRSELAGGGPLVDIGYALFLLGNPEVRAVSASTYDLLATTGFGVNPDSNKTGATGEKTFDVEDLASAFIRLSDGGTLLVEASWAAHRRDGDEFGITLYGTHGGAELIVDDYEPVGSLRIFGDDGGSPVATQVTAKPGRGHVAVVEQFLAKVHSGDWHDHDGSTAATLARVVDACYRSAAEESEVRLDAVTAVRAPRPRGGARAPRSPRR